MKAKTFEVRDRSTLIPCLGISIEGSDGYLAQRAGYGQRCILFGKLSGGAFTYDPHEHKDSRTMRNAHAWVRDNWDIVADGQVIDVEYILGESKWPKESEGKYT